LLNIWFFENPLDFWSFWKTLTELFTNFFWMSKQSLEWTLFFASTVDETGQEFAALALIPGHDFYNYPWCNPLNMCSQCGAVVWGELESVLNPSDELPKEENNQYWTINWYNCSPLYRSVSVQSCDCGQRADWRSL